MQDESLGYMIDDVLVSDFCCPSWFDYFDSQGPFNFRNTLTDPLTLAPGGYVLVYEVPNSGTGWTTVTAENAPNRANGMILAEKGEHKELHKELICDRVNHAVEVGRSAKNLKTRHLS